jgi:hypothetical protein
MVTYESILRSALASGVSIDIVERAAYNINSGIVTLLGFSGKMASGKDSVAAAVIARNGLIGAIHYSFANPLKSEVDMALNYARSKRFELIKTELKVASEAACATFIDLVKAAIEEYPAATARTRTPGIRRVLQFWGTEVRRAEDPDYWVKQAHKIILEHAAHGTSVYFTDGRFPNEISGSQSIGFRVIRLNVGPEVQAKRLSDRDGLLIDSKALQHASETALDDFDGFDLIVDNEGLFESSVEKISQWLSIKNVS